MFGRSNDKLLYELFEKNIANTLVCAEELRRLFGDIAPTNRTIIYKRVAKIKELEHRGDDLMREAHQLLDRTFITGIDKSDIQILIKELDDMIDCMNATAVCIAIYHIVEGCIKTDSFMKVIIQMILALQKLIKAISHVKLETTRAQVIEIKELEEEADTLLHQALESLFQDASSVETILNIIKWKDIFEKLERVTDHCEDVANVILSIARKEAR